MFNIITYFKSKKWFKWNLYFCVSFSIYHNYFVLFENSIFDDVIKKYKKTDEYKKVIKILEKLYGKDSVTLLTAFVQYHDNY